MKVVFDEEFYDVYTPDPAAAPGRMEAVVKVIEPYVDLISSESAPDTDILLAHTQNHLDMVNAAGLHLISALAVGCTITAARIGLKEPCLALVRPPGHHASMDSAWGFCYYNNMAIALLVLKDRKEIRKAHVLDIDLHYGDGTVEILDKMDWVTVFNPNSQDREEYLDEVRRDLDNQQVDIIGISAGFDNHLEDWGGVLATEDYYEIGRIVRLSALHNNGGCFAVLEGGYNHQVLGHNVLALIEGLKG